MAFLIARRSIRRLASVAALLGLLISAGGADLARAEGVRDNVKAAYLYNFARFCEWPDAVKAKPALTVGVLGDRQFAEELVDQLKDRPLDGKMLKVVALSSPEDAPTCDIVYVRGARRGDAATILKTTAGMPILTVGDADTFSRAGGMISFMESNGVVRFAVNTASVQKSGLKISSQMLQYAIIINEHSGADRRARLA